MTSPLAVRLHPTDATTAALGHQYRSGIPSTDPVVLVRTVPQEPAAIDPVGLPVLVPSGWVEVAVSWTDAQLVADATMLGLGVGLRVVLVPDAGRWYADLLVVRTGGRLRGGRGYRDPQRALEAVRQSLLASFDTSARPGPTTP